MRASILSFLLLLTACGRVDGSNPTQPPDGGEPSDTQPDSTDPNAGLAGTGAVNLYVAEGQIFAFARFNPGPAERANGPARPGCIAVRAKGGTERPEVSAGTVTVSGTADGKPFSVPLKWDAKKRQYADPTTVAELPGTKLGTLRFRAEGDEAPPFDTLLEPLAPVAIQAPVDEGVLDVEDLVVRWDTVGSATVLVSLMTGGDVTIDCMVPGTSREVTIPRALVREALDGGTPATCQKGPCATLIVGTFTGARVDARGANGDAWAVSVSHGQLAARTLHIAPK